MFKLYLFLLLFFTVANGFAQQRIEGEVKERNGQLLDRVIVQLRDAQGKTLYQGFTNEKGYFVLNTPSKYQDTLFLKFSLLSFKSETIKIDKKYLSFLRVQLTPQAIQLKEVKVKIEKIKLTKDTITYNAESYAKPMDNTIGDVLKRLPGIEVTKDGGILYQGKPINKFYIEGLNLLENRYGLATNNISNKVISEVQVLEHHQPIKILDSLVYSDQAAINLILKNDAKLRWNGNLEGSLGGGNDFNWDMKLNALKISKLLQNFGVLKSNNTGGQLLKEIKKITLQDLIDGKLELSEINSPFVLNNTDLPIPENKSLFNKSILLSSNLLNPIKKDLVLRSNVNYVLEQKNSKNITETTYILPNVPEIKIAEINNYQSSTNLLAGDFFLERNDSKQFIKNRISIKKSWENQKASILTNNSIFQTAKTPLIAIENENNWVYKKGNSYIKINSFNHYHKQLSSLSILNIQNQNDISLQTINNERFHSEADVSETFRFLKLNFDVKGGYLYSRESIKTDWNKTYNGISLDSLNSNNLFSKLSFFVNSSINYKKNDFQMEGKIRLEFSSGNFARASKQYQRFFFNPEFFMRYKLNPFLEISYRATKHNKVEDINSLLTNFIFSNYRTANVGNNEFLFKRSFAQSLILNYRNPLQAIFVSTGINYALENTNQIPYNYFYNNILVNTFQLMKTPTSSVRIFANLSKEISSLNLIFKLQSSHFISQSKIFVGGNVNNYKRYVWLVKPIISLDLLNSGLVEYESSINQVTSINDMLHLKQRRLGYNHSISFSKRIKQTAVLRLTYDYVNSQITDNQYTNTSFFDFDFKQKIGKKIDVNLTAKNILNNKTFQYSSVSSFTQYESQTFIRPINILIGCAYRF